MVAGRPLDNPFNLAHGERARPGGGDERGAFRGIFKAKAPSLRRWVQEE